MMARKQHIVGVSRFVVALIAMQWFVAGFCLMMPQTAQAMPIAETMLASMHCEDAMQSHHAMQPEAQDEACAHCDQPEQLLPTLKDVNHVSISLFVLPYAVSHLAQNTYDVQSFVNPTDATAPPDSVALIYTTTQRIRI